MISAWWLVLPFVVGVFVGRSNRVMSRWADAHRSMHSSGDQLATAAGGTGGHSEANVSLVIGGGHVDARSVDAGARGVDVSDGVLGGVPVRQVTLTVGPRGELLADSPQQLREQLDVLQSAFESEVR